MAELEKLSIPVQQNGIVRESAVDEMMSPPESVEWALNVNFDRIGAVQLKDGTTLLGSQISAGNSVLGMGLYVNNARTIFRALAKVDTSVYSYNGSSWSAVRTGLTASGKARFTSLVDYIFMVNGSSNEACSSWAGSGSFGTTNIDNLPSGDFIENYRSRIWIADATTDKVYYSDVVNTDNTITGGDDFIQVSPQDGEKITGLFRHPRALLVFKNNHIYRVFSINSIDPDPSIMRGTYSQESIVQAKDGIYYHHPTGFYKFNFDGEQEEISRPIIDIVRAISRSNYESIAGWADDDHVYWSIGDVTIPAGGNVTITKTIVRYTLSTQTWTIYQSGSRIRSSSQYDDGTTLYQLVGDSDGNVLIFNSGNDDNGTPISYDLITHPFYFTNIKSTQKTISAISTLHQNAKTVNIFVQIDDKDWKPIGQILKDIYDTFTVDLKFIKIRFRIRGSSTGGSFIWRGFEILMMNTNGQIKKP